MMSGFMSYFGGRRDPKQGAREAIVSLREQLQMLEKREEHVQKKIDDEHRKARANAVSNKNAATAALRRKKGYEQDLDRMQGTRLQLETQISTLEAANMNAETMAALKKGADALKGIHGKTTIDTVDATMNAIQEQTQLANEISEAISAPPLGMDMDEDVLKAELAELEQDELNERLMGADHVPIHSPVPAVTAPASKQRVAEEDDEDAQLRQLQAALAM